MSIAAGVREAIPAVDRDQPISAIRTMDDIVTMEELPTRRQQMILLVRVCALCVRGCAGHLTARRRTRCHSALGRLECAWPA